MDILPSIDIRDGKVVRLIQGDYDQQIDYDRSPVDVASQFAQAGAAWLHMVDLDGAKTGQVYNTAVIRDVLNSTDLKVEVGGGVRNQRTIQRLLDAGADRVIIGTRSLEDWEWFTEIVHDPDFREKIVLGMDARDGLLAAHGWTKQTKLAAVDLARKVSKWPLAAIVYTDIAKDGMLAGPNFEQVELVAKSTDVPVIASGGVTSLEDVERLKDLPVAGAIIGRAFYEGKIDLAEAVRRALE
ncbi:MAG: 1-(5-phosphoribosyl)-5-[(5-phosphoribosylamino)methylideneamino]imidazole-4-carboxamide isomerase [Phycisphaerae bacterium]|nr:1-(5-phosphoribosyl)-5-[(5-phosphoribosylamino)methylideneamino]imidazole-4-carboxamide isomerase [Phycisphaerae bacterium]